MCDDKWTFLANVIINVAISLYTFYIPNALIIIKSTCSNAKIREIRYNVNPINYLPYLFDTLNNTIQK